MSEQVSNTWDTAWIEVSCIATFWYDRKSIFHNAYVALDKSLSNERQNTSARSNDFLIKLASMTQWHAQSVQL